MPADLVVFVGPPPTELVVSIDGAPVTIQLGESAQLAAAAAAGAAASALAAENAANTALALSEFYPTLAAGVAATSVGEWFTSAESGTLTYYEHIVGAPYYLLKFAVLSGTMLSASGGSALVGFLQAGTGATSRTMQSKARDVVSICDYGAATSNTAAQNSTALNTAVAEARAAGRSLYVPPGTHMYNQIDFGENDAASPTRLVIHGPGTLKSTYSGTALIASTGYFYDLVIDGVRFESVHGSGTKLIDADKFIRLVMTPGTQILDHDWVLYGTSYMQSVRMIGCIVRGGAGAVVKVPLAFDCRFTHNIIEFVTDGIVIDGSGDPAVNTCTISDNVIEGIGGRAIVLGTCLASRVQSNYMEGNVGGDILLNAGTALHKGLTVQDNGLQLSADRVAGGTLTVSTTNGSPTITVTTVGAGKLLKGSRVAAAGVPDGARVIAYGTGTGGLGTYTLSANATATATGVALTATNWGIVWGSSLGVGARAGGNFCTGNLHDNSLSTAFIDVSGDYAAGQLYRGYAAETVTGRAPYGRAVYNAGESFYVAWFGRYMTLDAYSQEVRFGGKNDSAITGTTEPPVISFGLDSPQSGPGLFERTKWAKGSVVLSANATVNGSVGWICTVAGVPGTWLPIGTVGMIQSAAQADFAGADLAAVKVELNALLAKLRTARVLAP